MSIKRYDAEAEPDRGDGSYGYLQPSDTGEAVLYVDHLAEIAALRERCERLEYELAESVAMLHMTRKRADDAELNADRWCGLWLKSEERLAELTGRPVSPRRMLLEAAESAAKEGGA